ncbi:MAG: F-box/LRR-repeat protein 14 [Schlesneria sp.]|nr:F-box/LRR-repeat protein 14 [Schlesneria sp.]
MMHLVRRFGVRFFAVVVLVITIYGVTSFYSAYHREQRIAKLIEDGGGDVAFAHFQPRWLAPILPPGFPYFARITRVRLRITNATLSIDQDYVDGFIQSDRVIDGLSMLRHLQQLDLNNTGIEGHRLKFIRHLPNLETLSLGFTRTDDTLLAELGGLSNLQSLRLNHTQISDGGLAHLKQMSQLKELYLGGTAIGDVGVIHLSGLTNLEELDLRETRITDAGLDYLIPLVNLKRLYVARSQVTPEGRARIRKALPNRLMTEDR